jgi:hypothetical protein
MNVQTRICPGCNTVHDLPLCPPRVSSEEKAASPGFRITGKKGFHITFANGYTVSVQFGPGNYCDNYDRRIGYEDEECGVDGSRTAECAVWAADGNLIDHFDGNSVSNRSRPADVLALLNWAASQERRS